MVARESSQARQEEEEEQEQDQEQQEDNCTKSCDIANPEIQVSTTKSCDIVNPEIRVSTTKTTNDDLSQPSSLTHVELSESAKIGRSRRSVEKQARKKHKGGPSAAEVRLLKKYLQTAELSNSEVGVDDSALCKLLSSSTFRKFVHRSELEDEVFVLHQQLQQEVELHTSLERAFAHASGALPNIVPRDLPVNAQKLLSDIATLEAAVLKLETQTTALQWELIHERTEREVMENCLNPNPPPNPATSLHQLSTSEEPASPSRISTSTPQDEEESSQSIISSPRTPLPNRRDDSSPPATPPMTIKELLRMPCPHTVVMQQTTPPKSPVHMLRSLWSHSHDSTSSSSDSCISSRLRIRFSSSMPKRSDVTSSASPKQNKCFLTPSSPSPAAKPIKQPVSPSPVFVISSPFTPPPASPITPEKHTPELRLRDLPKLLPSAKRLAFWNFAHEDNEASSLPQDKLPPPQQQKSWPDQQGESPSAEEKRSTYRSEVLRVREIRSRGFTLDSPEPSSGSSSVLSSTSTSSSDSSSPDACTKTHVIPNPIHTKFRVQPTTVPVT